MRHPGGIVRANAPPLGINIAESHFVRSSIVSKLGLSRFLAVAWKKRTKKKKKKEKESSAELKLFDRIFWNAIKNFQARVKLITFER